MLNPWVVVMGLLGRSSAPLLPRAKRRAASAWVLNPFRRLRRVYPASGGAEDCD